MNRQSTFYYLTKIFGLAPFSNGQVVSRNRQWLNDLLLICPTSLVCVLFIGSLFSIFWHSGNQSETSNITNWLQFIPNAFSYLLILLNSVKNKVLLQDIMFSFITFDDKVKMLLGLSLNKAQQASSRITSLMSITSTGLGLTFISLYAFVMVNFNQLWTLFYFLAFVIPKLGIFLYSFQFTYCLVFISKRIYLLSECVKNYSSKEFFKFNYHANKLEENKKNNTLQDQFYNKKRHRNVHVSSIDNAVMNPRFPSIDSSDLVDAIHETTQFLSEIASKINDYFGMQILASLTSAFICITVQLYYLINHMRFGFIGFGQILSFCSFLLILLHMIEFGSVLTAGENVKSKWMDLIHNLLLMKANGVDEAQNTKISDIVTAMSLKKMEFTASNIFPIDLSIVTGTFAAITTYLIVVIQFKLSEEQLLGYNHTFFLDEKSSFTQIYSQKLSLQLHLASMLKNHMKV